MRKIRYSLGLPLAGTALLTGCAVYVPTVPGTPLLRSKGAVEITAAVGNPNTAEAGAAWAPAAHLLVTGEAALQAGNDSQTSNNVTTTHHSLHRQGGLGLGTYRLLGKDESVYLGAVGGVGIAAADLYYPSVAVAFILPVPGPDIHYEASYWRYYGQVYVAHQGPRVSYGLSVRNTWANYRRLVRDGVPVALRTQSFLEPTLFVRVGRGAIQGLGAIGFSSPGRVDHQNPDTENLAPATTLLSVGVVVRPQLFGHRHSPGAPQ